MALLEIREVTRRFGSYTALDHVNISVEAGEFFTLLGPSGCGKTTLLRMIAGFDLPDSGQILLDGKDMVGTPPEKRPVHTVFQTYALFPHMTVAENIAFPLKMARKQLQEIKLRVGEALDNVRLSDLGHRFPHELSGGQKQRVAFARGLVNRPRLLLLDEPLGALDAKLREEMQIELINLQKNVGVTFVFVTHAQNEALALSHRIAVMNRGNVEQVDEPSRIYSSPKNRFVANFIGKISILDATVLEAGPSHLKLDVADLGQVTAPGKHGIKAGDRGAMAIRPEQIRISHPSIDLDLKNHFYGKVHDFLYVGDVTTYIVELSNGASIEALLPNSAPERAKFFEVGDEVAVSWRHDAGIFLNE
jgi:spermidine/putrescine transport system ATP-binding protein